MKPLPTLSTGAEADVTLLLEGTYPYVSGGVSTWVHELISGLPELRFAVAFLGSEPDAYDGVRYDLPPNLVHVETHYLMTPKAPPPVRPRAGEPSSFTRIERLHEAFRRRREPLPRDLTNAALSSFGDAHGVTEADFLYSEESWNRLRTSYERYSTDPSFVDYFWTVRSMHTPLFCLARIAAGLPETRVLHAVSTGYAGFLGALAAHRRRCPFVLTEHGIYTKERRIDIAHASWIKDSRDDGTPGLEDEVSHIRWLWIRFFEGLGRMAYAAANPILALYEGNRRRQIADGADPTRTALIPNGIDIERFWPLADNRPVALPLTIGLMGRVVPIKDVRTFVRAMRIICSHRPDAEGWIVGPEDEDASYARECRDLVATFGLQDRVKFLGFRRPEEIMPHLGLLMLTSISEALPLVVLESFASGVPVVATDVGACRELVEGKDAEDQALGRAGRIVPIASPEAAAQAALALLEDPGAWSAAQAGGRARVRQTYTRQQMFDRYRAVYDRALEDARGRDRLRAS